MSGVVRHFVSIGSRSPHRSKVRMPAPLSLLYNKAPKGRWARMSTIYMLISKIFDGLKITDKHIVIILSSLLLVFIIASVSSLPSSVYASLTASVTFSLVLICMQ